MYLFVLYRINKFEKMDLMPGIPSPFLSGAFVPEGEKALPIASEKES